MRHFVPGGGGGGQPQLGGAPGPAADQAWVVATVPTDYAISLEMDAAGAKAFIADSMLTSGPAITAALAQTLREAWEA